MSATANPQKVLTAGDVKVIIDPWQQGVSILIGGVAVSNGSSMVVTTPPWTPHFYLGPSHEAILAGEIETLPNGQRIVLSHRGERGAFTGTDTITAFADGRVERVLEGTFNEADGEALIQWQVAALNPVLIKGLPYRATLADGKATSGSVPVMPRGSDRSESTLAAGIRTLEFDSRIGPIRIEVESERTLTCYDHRGSRWANPARPLFWFGDLGTRFKQGDPIEYRIVFHLPPARTLAGGPLPGVDTASQLIDAPQAQTIATGDRPVILPTPKQVTWGDGTLLTLPDYVLEPLDFGKDLQPEGYAIVVDADGVRVAAADAAGQLNARRTLAQLAAPTGDGRVTIPHVSIVDWPTLAFRGVHAFTGGQGPDLHLKLFENIVGGLKMNHVVLESEYTEWDAYPELHHPQYGMPKSDIRRILALCREQGIEVTPLVMSLGHCQWMFETTDKFLHLAEDPEAKWAYCVTNPETYEFIFTIYQEAVDLFEPRYFHIGHDEYADRGRVPYRESSKPYTIDELFMMDTLRHHAWFSERDIRVMMWGDMLLAKGEAPDATNAKSPEAARSKRDQLPNDVIITDWHYVETEPENYTSLELFENEGHATIASSWSRPGNIINFARAAHDSGSMGLLQTTWAGYSLDPASFARELHQYVAWVVAAEAAWNADRPIDADGFLAGEHFLRLMSMTSLTPANRGGWLADLSGLQRYPLAAADARGWFGLGPEHDLRALPSGRVRLRGVEFQLSDRGAVLLSQLTRGEGIPGKAELFVRGAADTLVFLHTMNFACRKGTTVGVYEVDRADGSIAKIDLVYGENILAYDDLAPAADAPIMWSGPTQSGKTVGVRALIWQNPRPDVPIRAIRARSTNAAGSVIWLGLTGLRDAAARGD